MRIVSICISMHTMRMCVCVHACMRLLHVYMRTRHGHCQIMHSRNTSYAWESTHLCFVRRTDRLKGAELHEYKSKDRLFCGNNKKKAYLVDHKTEGQAGRALQTLFIASVVTMPTRTNVTKMAMMGGKIGKHQ